jgi:chitinase
MSFHPSRFAFCSSFSSSFFLLLCVLSAAPFLAHSAHAQTTLPKRIVGDYGYWSKSDTPPYSAAQIPYNMLTHINHAGVSFNANGSLSVPEGFLEPDLNSKAHAAGVKVLLLLGGDFEGVETGGSAALTTLVQNILAFEQQYNYDGVDMDWEYPATGEDRHFFVGMMAELRASNPNYVLSIDAAPWGGSGYDLKALQLSLNYFNIMMYDCAGPWTTIGQLNSPIFWDWHDPAGDECNPGGSDDSAATIFLSDVPGDQLNMGTPFYGYFYLDVSALFGACSKVGPDGNCDDGVQTLNYGPQIKWRINRKGWYTQYDPIALVPYMLRTDGSPGYITYDDSNSTFFRVYYSDWTRGLGGTFMWSLDADYDGHSQDLLDAMYAGTLAGVH